jgi:squalene-associated FAD-dependent desaturase
VGVPHDSARQLVVIGGGLAGLSTAVELTRQGEPVTLIEARPGLGGRIRASVVGPYRVDWGHHLALGSYAGLLSLLRRIGQPEKEVLYRGRLRLRMRSLKARGVSLSLPPIMPPPLHVALAMLSATGLTVGQRLVGLYRLRRMLRYSVPERGDESVRELIQRYELPIPIGQQVLEPLCAALLHTPPERASARVFVRMLRESFSEARQHSDLLLPLRPLADALIEPARAFVESHGGRVLTDTRVDGLVVRREITEGVQLEGSIFAPARQVVIAASHREAARLLDPHPELEPVANNLRRLESEDACTVYLQYPPDHRMDQPMQGLLDGISQWVFDRRFCDQPGLMAVTVTPEGPHLALDDRRLGQAVADEIARFYPWWERPREILVIRQKDAVISAGPGIDALRPGNGMALRNLWLAGDYTDTGLPANLEGAVRSGLRCARKITQSAHSPHRSR